MNRAGVALMDRVTIDAAALAAGVYNGGSTTDLIAYQIAEGLGRLDAAGADLVHGTTAVTIGEHPDFPSGLTIELKASKLKDDDIAIAPVDEADLPDTDDESDDGILTGP